VKVAVVVQRYGADINGGAELHARYVAERLARHVEVEVLTTCARDYISWRNALPAGVEQVNGVIVRRFPVAYERDPDTFGERSRLVFEQPHALRDELAWLESEGPASPELISYIRAHEAAYDFFVFFSFRYHHAWHGARAVPGRAVLVPTAERDGALGLAIFGPVFRGVRALMYNSFEEQALINSVSANQEVPGVVVGVGSEIPERTSPGRFRQAFGIRERFAVYVGRIDENKGCAELFDFFQHYSRLLAEGLDLVLIGHAVIPIPEHPRIHHLGFVSDQDKFDALAASELLVMPSYFESLSMVALEAWALGKPVLANARCDVLKGQCIRSNGGLYYDGFEEFFETLRTLDANRTLGQTLGRNGLDYFTAHYSWPVIERKYLEMFSRLAAEPARAGAMEALPGWFARRRRNLSPADEVVRGLPTGPALQPEPTAKASKTRPVAQGPMPQPPQAATQRATAGAPKSEIRRSGTGPGTATSRIGRGPGRRSGSGGQDGRAGGLFRRPRRRRPRDRGPRRPGER
jgi:glycosyltransferase involved in cell wall biosynthesis